MEGAVSTLMLRQSWTVYIVEWRITVVMHGQICHHSCYVLPQAANATRLPEKGNKTLHLGADAMEDAISMTGV